VGRRLVVERFDPFHSDVTTFRPAIGVCTAKLTSTTCRVQLWGILRGIYTGLIPGRRYVLDASALPAIYVPAPVGGIAWSMPIGIATSTDEIMISPQAPSARRV